MLSCAETDGALTRAVTECRLVLLHLSRHFNNILMVFQPSLVGTLTLLQVIADSFEEPHSRAHALLGRLLAAMPDVATETLREAAQHLTQRPASDIESLIAHAAVLMRLGAQELDDSVAETAIVAASALYKEAAALRPEDACLAALASMADGVDLTESDDE